MALRLIGAGFGRTGTLSLKVALETLGCGPCYHMMEVLGKPAHVDLWSRAADGEAIDWEDLFDGYPAAVDWPACYFWRELVDRYPAAPVLLSLRDPAGWYKSVRSTIYRAMTEFEPPDVPAIRKQLAMTRKIVLEQTFGGRFEEEAHAISVFERHNEAVKAAIPAERLLVYEPGDGWEPLCKLLDVPVPDEPFPHVNSTEDFLGRFGIEG